MSRWYVTRAWWIILLIGILTLPSRAAWAETKAGDLEVSAAFSLTHLSPDEGKSTTTVVTLAALGYFLTAPSEIQLSAAGAVSEDVGLLLLAARYNYHFNTASTTVYYVGPQAGVVYIKAADTTDSRFAFGGQAGVKFFLAEQTTLFAEYSLVSDSDSNIQHTVLIGLSYFFR